MQKKGDYIKHKSSTNKPKNKSLSKRNQEKKCISYLKFGIKQITPHSVYCIKTLLYSIKTIPLASSDTKCAYLNVNSDGYNQNGFPLTRWWCHSRLRSKSLSYPRSSGAPENVRYDETRRAEPAVTSPHSYRTAILIVPRVYIEIDAFVSDDKWVQ